MFGVYTSNVSKQTACDLPVIIRTRLRTCDLTIPPNHTGLCESGLISKTKSDQCKEQLWQGMGNMATKRVEVATAIEALKRMRHFIRMLELVNESSNCSHKFSKQMNQPKAKIRRRNNQTSKWTRAPHRRTSRIPFLFRQRYRPKEGLRFC